MAVIVKLSDKSASSSRGQTRLATWGQTLAPASHWAKNGNIIVMLGTQRGKNKKQSWNDMMQWYHKFSHWALANDDEITVYPE